MQDNLEATITINIGLLWLYQSGLESTFWRGTIGKRIVGIRRVVGDVVASHTNHTLSWLLKSHVDRLTTVRRTVEEAAA